MAEGFFGNLFGDRHLLSIVEAILITTILIKWSSTPICLNGMIWRTEGIEKGRYSLDDMYFPACYSAFGRTQIEEKPIYPPAQEPYGCEKTAMKDSIVAHETD